MMDGLKGEHLETRKFQTKEVARLLRVFPSMIGAADNEQTHASAEQFFTAHVVHTLMPWAVRFEQVIERDCLTESDLNAGYYVKLQLNGLLRGDSAARAAFYKAGINDGWLTRNEVRIYEDLKPLPGLDKPLQPLNMVEAGTAPRPVPAPAPAPDAPADPPVDDSADA
jgi:HK97 family phage portal protein